MTNNIVAQFACSFYTSRDQTKHRIPAGKVVGDLKEYEVVNGSVFNHEYNETLDSATIILSQIPADDRLSRIAAYQFVRVFDKSGKTGLDKIFLVDNYDEKENNLTEHIFGYTIALMSETKLLEKMQCPNLAATHKIKDGEISKKTIYQYIKQYMELFVPKMKFTDGVSVDYSISWDYVPLITLPKLEDSLSGYRELTATSENTDLETGRVTASFPIPADAVISSIENITVNAVPQTGLAFATETLTVNTETRTLDFVGQVNMLGPNPPVIIGKVWGVYYGFDYHHEAGQKFYDKFNVPCADLPFTVPTLRQLLTMLMQQVGCIPTVKNRILGFLDFRAEEHDIFGGEDGEEVKKTVNYIHRSLSSDSYVNTLVNTSSGVLDSGNEVICETLGFRDRGNLLLRQQSNLNLETRFPIYNVRKFEVNFFANVHIKYPRLNNSFNPRDYRNNVNPGGGITDYVFSYGDGALGGYFEKRFDQQTNKYRIFFSASTQLSSCVMRNVQFYPLKSLSGGGYDYYYDGLGNIISIGVPVLSSVPNPNTGRGLISFEQAFDDLIDVDNPQADFDECYMICESVELTYYTGVSGVYDSITFKTVGSTFVFDANRVMFFKQDITPLLVENSVRAYLKTDFIEMTERNFKTIEELGEYIYGTVGYSIGSNQISGFSDTYQVGSATVLGWITKGYTYIENIMNFVVKHVVYNDTSNFDVIVNKYKVPFVLDNNTTLSGYTRNNVLDTSDSEWYHPENTWYNLLNIANFTSLFFNIYYQPLNSFNLSYVKKDESVDFLLEQYDGNASGLTDFDRLSTNEQEQVDRIGNENVSIAQVTDNFNLIRSFDNGPIVYEDDTNRDGSLDENDKGVKYVIFKRTFTVNNNHFNVNYVGSKDAILKNYFTSIRTKYRAYQYIDYSSSVLRKEKDRIFVRISEDWYDGDDKIWFGNWNANPAKNILRASQLIYNFGSNANDGKALQYVSEYGKNEELENEFAKNDISIICNDNSLAIIYESPDNVGNGTYISNVNFSTSYVFSQNENGGADDTYKIGGVPQSWQIWDEDTFNEKHSVIYLYGIDFFRSNYYKQIDEIVEQPAADAIETARSILETASQVPIVDSALIDTYAGNNIGITIVDKNDGINFTRTFYKDYAERINHTLQFIYYRTDKYIAWTEHFIENSPLVNRTEYAPNAVVYCDEDVELTVDREPHKMAENEHLEQSLQLSDYVSMNFFNSVSGFTVEFNGHRIVKLCHRDDFGNIRDVIAFKSKTEQQTWARYFISLNDTKSDYVMAEQNGVLYRKYKVIKTTEVSQVPARTCIQRTNDND